MLYKFKSNADADVVMLEATGAELLKIIGKDHQSTGILLPEQMATALSHLREAIASEEASGAQALSTKEGQSDEKTKPRISLRTRAWPLLMMIERSLSERTPVTW